MPPKKASSSTDSNTKATEPPRRSTRERKSTAAPANNENDKKDSEKPKANAGKKRSASAAANAKDNGKDEYKKNGADAGEGAPLPKKQRAEPKPAASKMKSLSAASKKDQNKDKKKDEKKDDKQTIGSKHDAADEDHGQPGSATRLPSKGQKVTWRAMPGWVHGTVLEVVTSTKDMQGKHIKASKEDPRIALKAESGKFCVHKPDVCYF